MTKIVMWKFHVDKYSNCISDMLIGRYLITALGLELKFSNYFIIGDKAPYEGCSSTIVKVSSYKFTFITDKS